MPDFRIEGLSGNDVFVANGSSNTPDIEVQKRITVGDNRATSLEIYGDLTLLPVQLTIDMEPSALIGAPSA